MQQAAMQRTRPFTTQRIYGMGFIVVVLKLIVGIHLTFVLAIWGPHLRDTGAGLVLFVYHLSFLNLCIAFYQCIMTDPGVVPPNWGFYMGDETKRRRYCKMCNVWKPERTHHCSICNRCILNMDHHCPWINNCVGFYNRKFFIQLLGYVYATLLVVVLTSLPIIYMRFVKLVRSEDIANRGVYCVVTLIIAAAYCLSVLLICTLTNFIKFHLKLVLDNYTTIENLEREEGAKSKFDIGSRRNWEQVFGAAQWLWWFPAHIQASRPIGDGVRWRVHYTSIVDEEEDFPADDDAAQTNRLLP